MALRHIVKIITLLLVTECIRSLKLLQFDVPGHVPQGARAQLSCRWALARAERLYSVKWYKDGKEFFRYVPKNQEPRIKFKLPGVEVEYSDPSGSNLTLLPATLESSGRYRCEVSGEKPLFPTVSDHANMEVIVFPDHGPVTSGLHPRYQTGDRVEVSCTSGRSQPATRLAWYINGEPAPATALRPPTRHKDQGLYTTELTLDFILTEKHFIDNRFKIKCLATQFPFYWKSNEGSALKLRTPINTTVEEKSTQIFNIKDPLKHFLRTTANSGYKLVTAAMLMIRLGTIKALLSYPMCQ